ncbi:PAS domain S-box protein [Marinobacter sp. 2_MG-2023]|uniref:PAS domain-containing sensor histidine kinase n=1 Tax=Marinobacter sp. 2_MG-2023 TaxID=3062679 RepID=UPI0026E3A777|nr:PAS domain S-box protein [Marinobacter sp. 2_MG-2023]MDO6440939.1 PAS domain S-box protein [Marinobacter sp. 2_MG-2023]
MGFSLSDADPQPGLILSADATLLHSNRAAEALQVANRLLSPVDLLPTNTQALVKATMAQVRAIENVEARINNTILMWTFIPSPDSGEVLARGRDATDDVRTHDEAIRSNRLYRLITENTTDLISRHAPDGRFIDATPASWRLLGYSPEELRGKPLEDIFHSDNTARQLMESHVSLRDDGYATMTLDITHVDGSKRWFEIASRAIRETYTGAVVEVVSVSRDITARVESEESRRKLADELARTARLAALGELASSIAHEMNQPLATIVNFASASQRYLKSAETNPEHFERVSDGLKKTIHHANRASEVIKRLRAFLRKGQKRTATVALNQTLANVARLCQWEADKNYVDIVCAPDACGPSIIADPVLLEQVLINLIRNGIEANEEARGILMSNSGSSLVLSTSVNEAGETLIEVTDEGPGLDDQGIRQMFQPFYTSKPHGLGLGLSMSRSIVEGFGGFLDAKPASTGGLTLTCRFPPTSVKLSTINSETSTDE